MKKRRNIWIPVVTGLLRKNGHVLVGQRPSDKSLPGVWEFPGGKVEAGEAPDVALERELNEELAIEAEVGSLRFSTTHQYGDINILILFYDVPYWKGQPKAVHHSELKWVAPDQLSHLELPEANRKVLRKILALLN